MFEVTAPRKCLLVVLLVLSTSMLEAGSRKMKNRHRLMENYDPAQGDHVWEAGEWNQCMKGKRCSEPGTQRRMLSCFDPARKKTSSRNCNRGLRPARKRPCVPVQCKNQTSFKLRFWPWSPCASRPLLGINIPDVLKRNRTVQAKNSNRVDQDEYPILKDHSNWRSHVVEACGSLENTIVFVKRRNISCIASWTRVNTQIQVPIENCLENSEQAPESLELCSFGCVRKCVVTFWSRWRTCETCRKKIRYRKRQVAFVQNTDANLPNAEKTDGNLANAEKCPHLLETQEERFNVNITRRTDKAHQFQAANWSSCAKRSSGYFGNKTATIGFRKRSVVCVDEKGKRVDCENGKHGEPTSVEICTLPRDCQVSRWGTWSTCNMILRQGEGQMEKKQPQNTAQYFEKRTRHIVVTSLSGGAHCPRLSEFRSCIPPEVPQYQQEGQNVTTDVTTANETFEWFLGKFAKCHSDGNNCANGVTRRDVFCIRRGDPKYNPVGSQFCTHMNKPAEESFCRTPCRQICVLGEWGEWSACMADCKENTTGAVHGTHYKVRRVIQYSGDPRACEDYAESRPCTLSSCVSWMAGTQTVCLMDNVHRTCGHGKTHRAVYCLNARGHQVASSLCKGKKPPRSLPCHVPCTDDCVVGTWSDWGPCQGECGLNGTRGGSIQLRKQRVLAYPGWSGRPCPVKKELSQKQSCLGTACGTYHWKAGLWSSCLVRPSRYGPSMVKNAANRECLIGSRVRSVLCLNNSGRRVRDGLCAASLKPSNRKECRLCKEDCVLSPWTKWNDCPSTCTESDSKHVSVRKRERFVITPGRDGGVACPSRNLLVQREKCRDCAVYVWSVGSWTRCIIAPGGSCIGLQARQVHCTKKNGELVNDGLCLEQAREKPEEVRECEERCNKNCRLTSWSSWSGCSKACGSGEALCVFFSCLKSWKMTLHILHEREISRKFSFWRWSRSRCSLVLGTNRKLILISKTKTEIFLSFRIFSSLWFCLCFSN